MNQKPRLRLARAQLRPPADDRLERAARRITTSTAVLLAVVDNLERAGVDDAITQGMRDLLLGIADDAAMLGGAV